MHGAKSRGEQAQVSQSHLSVESQRKHLIKQLIMHIFSATSCGHVCNVVHQVSSLETHYSGCALPITPKISDPPEGKQVFTMNHINDYNHINILNILNYS